MQRTIILGMPSDFYLYPLIKENLAACGFDVIDVSYPQKVFKYKNLRQRGYNFYRKTVLLDNAFKTKLRFSDYRSKIMATLEGTTPKAQYALIIRPDMYPIDVLKAISLKATTLHGYQWDGLNRFPLVKKYIHLFTRFYVFDPQDLEFSNGDRVHYITNFYFDIPRLLQKTPAANLHPQIYFLGTFERDRMAEIVVFLDKIRHIDIKKLIFIFDKRKRNKQFEENSGIQKSFPIDYEGNLALVRESSVVLDIANRVHEGLSFRAFEAICYEKKLITNVKSIRQYDFYNPKNIFIIGVDDDSKLKDFIFMPYEKLELSIREKYSFTNWIHNLLNISPFIPISRP